MEPAYAIFRCGNRQLGCFRDAAGPNAGSAHADLFTSSIHHSADALKIRIPSAAARIVRVTDHVPERRALAAKRAFHSHDNSSPIFTKLNKVSSLADLPSIRTRFDWDKRLSPRYQGNRAHWPNYLTCHAERGGECHPSSLEFQEPRFFAKLIAI